MYGATVEIDMRAYLGQRPSLATRWQQISPLEIYHTELNE